MPDFEGWDELREHCSCASAIRTRLIPAGGNTVPRRELPRVAIEQTVDQNFSVIDVSRGRGLEILGHEHCSTVVVSDADGGLIDPSFVLRVREKINPDILSSLRHSPAM